MATDRDAPLRAELEARPMVVGFIALAMGLCSAYSLWILAGLVPLCWAVRPRGLRVVVAALGLFGLLARPAVGPAPYFEDLLFEGVADVIQMPRDTAFGMSTVVDAGGKKFVLYLPRGSEVVTGDRIRFTAEVRPLREGTVRPRGAVGVMSPSSPIYVVARGSQFWRAGLAWRRSFGSFMSRYGDPATTPIVMSLCFNETSELPRSLWEDLRRTGTTHIVSTSGLHVLITAGFLVALLSVLPIPRMAQIAVLGVALMVYTAAAGFRPPMLRAVVMALVGLCAWRFAREPDGFSALAVAGTGYLLIDPDGIRDIGFVLSFIAVGGLLLFGGFVPETEGRGLRWAVRRWLGSFLRASVVAWLVTLPVIAYLFGDVSLVSVPANLAIVLVLPPVICGALAAWLVALVWPAAGAGILAVVVEPLSKWLLLSVQTLGDWPHAAATVPGFSAWWLVPVYLLMIAMWGPRVRPS